MITPEDTRKTIEKIKESKFDHKSHGSTRASDAGNPDPEKEYSEAIFMTTIDGQRIVFDLTTYAGADLKRTVPSIGIFIDKTSLRRTAKAGGAVIELTWNEVTEFIKKLKSITDTAEYG